MDVSQNMSTGDASSMLGHYGPAGDDLFATPQLNQSINCGEDDFDELLRHIGYSDLNAIESSELFGLNLNTTEDSLLLETDLKDCSGAPSTDQNSTVDHHMEVQVSNEINSQMHLDHSLGTVIIDPQLSSTDHNSMQVDAKCDGEFNSSNVMVSFTL
jgi:hypothetical protein